MLGEDFSELIREISPFVEPRIDIYQSNRSFFVSIDLAGARKEDFSVKRRDHTLLIEGKIDKNQIGDRFKVISSERFYGFFRREISIPKECHLEHLHAVLDKGILLITIPFSKKVQRENDHDID